MASRAEGLTEPGAGAPSAGPLAAVQGGKERPRACTGCARLKMKCKWSGEEGQNACDRCSRMKITCIVPGPSKKRARGRGIRVAQLEQKIDGLVSLLTQQNQNAHPEPSPSVVPGSAVAAQARDRPLETQSPRQAVVEATGPHVPTTAAAAAPRPTVALRSFPVESFASLPTEGANFEFLAGYTISYQDADGYLGTYRDECVPMFPFVPIPANMNAAALHREKPFLFWSIIRITASQPSSIQAAGKEWFLGQIGEKMIVRNERTLEIVQSILVQLCWSGDFEYALDSQVMYLLQLAVALTVDLGLNRAPDKTLVMHGMPCQNDHPYMMTLNRAKSRPAEPHTPEEMKAVLGAFYLNSLMAALWKRDHSMRQTSYLMKCCDKLQNASESNNDLYLVALVRFQHLSDRMRSIFPDDNTDDEGAPVFTPALETSISTLRREADRVFAAFEPVARTHPLLLTKYYYVLVRLYEPVIYMRPAPPSAATYSDHGRIDALWKCLDAARASFESWLEAGPPSFYVFSTSASMSTMAFCLATATRLLLAGHMPAAAEWDPRQARARVDLPSYTERVADRLEAINEAARTSGRRWRLLPDGTPALLRTVEKTRWVRSWFHGRVAAEEGGKQPVISNQAPQPSGILEPGVLGNPGGQQAMENLNVMDMQIDDDFWRNIMITDAIFYGNATCPEDYGRWSA